MNRLITLAACLGAAIVAALVFGALAHEAFGVSRSAIRTDALTSAAVMVFAMAAVRLVKRDK